MKNRTKTTPPVPTHTQRPRRRPGRVAYTVGVSLFPAHREWLRTVKARTSLGTSAYLQALTHADMTSGGRVLAQALAVENEG